ncbi:MAG TPA: lysophospholipid acyltransferase family protein [Verrucomicrobiae bacterium]|jgi:1-acyl-sn-glycerol-3-phosphate acyltransferase|nr:lysophospholipid acyltransferase family protein [Verrucomicrobiae bacterium]
MKGLRQHPFRVAGRLIWFGGEVLFGLLVFLFRCRLRPKASRRRARAVWLQNLNRRVLHIFQSEIQTTGTIPSSGLLICNHLSYLDILVLSSLTPAIFVAKREVKSWPLMGLLAQLGGTVFIDRQRRTHVGQVNEEIETALNDGALVVIFPEGTSSDGKTILPFKSSLLEPATQQKHPIAAGCIQYTLADGGADTEICYWGDAVFLPHLLNLLGKRSVRVSVSFARIQNHSTDRKELAQQLHAEVLKLKTN